MGRKVLGVVMSVAGALVGGAVGTAVYYWMWKQNFHALVLPGAGLGLGCHLASPNRSFRRGLVLAVCAIVFGVVVEWWFRPFNRDESFAYFLKNLGDLPPATFLMLAVGGIFAFWWGREASPWFSGRPLPSRNG